MGHQEAGILYAARDMGNCSLLTFPIVLHGNFVRSLQVVATLRQTIKADDYRGKQLRFSGDVKVEHVEQQAGLYIRTNKQAERLRPENGVQGTHDWTKKDAPTFSNRSLQRSDHLEAARKKVGRILLERKDEQAA
jgi:hypothetical protein